MYIDNIRHIFNKYNKVYRSTIKMKPIDVKSSRYDDFNTKHNDTYPKFKVDGHVRISK